MRLVFLDIDGVLNNFASIAESVRILPEKVLLIQHLVNRTDAKVVISSSWKNDLTLKELKIVLGRAGLSTMGTIIGVTPSYQASRGGEIDRYIRENHFGATKDTGEEDRFVIIDDDDSGILEYQEPFFVKTHMKFGVTYHDIERAYNILTSKV